MGKAAVFELGMVVILAIKAPTTISMEKGVVTKPLLIGKIYTKFVAIYLYIKAVVL